jgi:hypothetical protein
MRFGFAPIRGSNPRASASIHAARRSLIGFAVDAQYLSGGTNPRTPTIGGWAGSDRDPFDYGPTLRASRVPPYPRAAAPPYPSVLPRGGTPRTLRTGPYPRSRHSAHPVPWCGSVIMVGVSWRSPVRVRAPQRGSVIMADLVIAVVQVGGNPPNCRDHGISLIADDGLGWAAGEGLVGGEVSAAGGAGGGRVFVGY